MASPLQSVALADGCLALGSQVSPLTPGVTPAAHLCLFLIVQLLGHLASWFCLLLLDNLEHEYYLACH